MHVEVTLRADESELHEVADLLERLAPGAAPADDAEEASALDLSEEKRYLLAAVQSSPGSALRVIHRTVTGLDGSPFAEYDREDGWNDEREAIQEAMWSLKEEGLLTNDGQRWYPTDEAPADALS